MNPIKRRQRLLALSGLGAIAWLALGCASGSPTSSGPNSSGPNSSSPPGETDDAFTPAPNRPIERSPRADARSTSGEGEVLRAEAHAAAGELDRALAEFERAIAINPELTVAYLGAGEIYRERGDYPAAEGLFREATRRTPRSYDAHYNLALTLQFMERLTEAVRSYLRALSINPDAFDANLNIATVYLELSEPAQATPYAEKAVALQPGSAEARINLAAASAALGNHERSVVEYQQAAELTPLTPNLLIGLADSLGQLRRHGEMLGTLQEAARQAETAPIYERMGSAQFHLRQYEASLGSFQRAIQLDEAYYPAWNGIAVNLLNRHLWTGGRDPESLAGATDALRRSLQIRPDQPRILQLLDRYGPN
ncbi:MAG: tetratricopeptide repeat protein [Planctomycetota bacterium]